MSTDGCQRVQNLLYVDLTIGETTNNGEGLDNSDGPWHAVVTFQIQQGKEIMGTIVDTIVQLFEADSYYMMTFTEIDNVFDAKRVDTFCVGLTEVNDAAVELAIRTFYDENERPGHMHINCSHEFFVKTTFEYVLFYTYVLDQVPPRITAKDPTHIAYT